MTTMQISERGHRRRIPLVESRRKQMEVKNIDKFLKVYFGSKGVKN
jgi:hypothetical protein